MEFDSLGTRIDSFYLANKDKIDNPDLVDDLGLGPLQKIFTIGPGSFQSLGICGQALDTDTAQVNKYLASVDAKQALPPNTAYLWGAKYAEDQDGNVTDFFDLYVIKVPKGGKAKLEGDVVTNAQPDINPTTGETVVSLKMNDAGAKAWRIMTKENLQRPVAIALDKRIYSAPTVQGEIPNGNTQITGNFSASEARTWQTSWK